MKKARRKTGQSETMAKRRALAYPRHAKAFAKPVRLTPLGRKQVGITPRVRDYVKSFKAKGLGEIALARVIVEDVRGFKSVALSPEKTKENWAKRSAEEVIRTREQYIMIPSEAAKTGKPAIMGCTDLSLAVVASLRAAGFNTLIVRAGTHTYAKFFYLGKVWIADTRDTKRNRVREMTPADKRNENKYRTANAFAEGPSLDQIGIRSYADFFKYRYRKRR